MSILVKVQQLDYLCIFFFVKLAHRRYQRIDWKIFEFLMDGFHDIQAFNQLGGYLLLGRFSQVNLTDPGSKRVYLWNHVCIFPVNVSHMLSDLVDFLKSDSC